MIAFVLGNGISRLEIDINLLSRSGSVFGCNALYRTYTPDVLVATDTMIANEIQKSGYSKSNIFYTRKPLSGYGAKQIVGKYRGFSSGPNAVAIAANTGYNKIILIGFDMAPTLTGYFNNVYADTNFYKKRFDAPTYTGNWIKQLKTIFLDYPLVQFTRVLGKTTSDINDFYKCHNYNTIDITDFVSNINSKSKDL